MCIEILIRLENCRLLENRCAPTVHLFYENINFDFCKYDKFILLNEYDDVKKIFKIDKLYKKKN